jgi:hypothetical protein
LGAVFLVYTGFALAWRRFIRRKQIVAIQESQIAPPSAQ